MNEEIEPPVVGEDIDPIVESQGDGKNNTTRKNVD